VLSTLLSARIPAGVAVAAARELFRAGYRTPAAMAAASWQDRVDALGRGGYRRYDERTATMLGEGAALASRRWHGDLRRLHAEAGGQADRAASLLTAFPGIGPAGAAIFLREAQGTWTDLAPFADARMHETARRLGLPDRADELAALAGPPGQFPRLAAALVRVSLSRRGVEDLVAAAGG
jgi:endonuclease III